MAKKKEQTPETPVKETPEVTPTLTIVEEHPPVEIAEETLTVAEEPTPAEAEEQPKIAYVHGGVGRIAAGTVIETVTGRIEVVEPTAIRFDGTEQSFAGLLVMWHPGNLAKNAENLRFKYDGNAVLLPIDVQCAAEEAAAFIATLTPEEAYGMGVSKEAYERAIALAKTE